MGNSSDNGGLARTGSRATVVVAGALWRRRILVIVVTLGCLLMAFGLSSFKDERYRAETRVFLSPTSPFDAVGGSGFNTDADRYVVTQATVLTSLPVLDRAAEAPGVDVDAEELAELVETTPGRDTDVVLISAEADSARQAVLRADAVVAAYRELVADRVESQAEAVAELSTSRVERAAVLKRATAFGDGVAVAEPAQTPDEPYAPNTVLDLLLGLIAGVTLSIALALGLELRNDAARRRRSAPPRTRDLSGSARRDTERAPEGVRV